MPDLAQNIIIQPLRTFQGSVNVLRLDQIHPIVSGNKWFKLKPYLQDATLLGADTLASFGGPFSNHIVALAYMGRAAGFATVGFIRGEETARLSPTLFEARSFGMELVFIDRALYRDNMRVREKYAKNGWYWISEGGYGLPGAAGAADILEVTDTSAYSHIVCACGTGTMMAGLVKKALPHQNVIGISVLKGASTLEAAVNGLLNDTPMHHKFHIIEGYHFGGYAKHPESLLWFIRNLWESEKLPTDIVYTSKLCYAVKELSQQQFFPEGSRVLVIHSGGLQGNASLPSGTLPFS